MKKIIILSILMTVGSMFYGYKIMAENNELEAVKVPLNNYLQAQATGDPEKRSVLRKNSKLNMRLKIRQMTSKFRVYY